MRVEDKEVQELFYTEECTKAGWSDHPYSQCILTSRGKVAAAEIQTT